MRLRRPQGPLRSVAGVAVAVVVALAGAVVVGEYAITPLTGLGAGSILALAIGGALGAVAGRGRRWLVAVTAALASSSAALGVWLAGGRGLQPWPPGGWVAVGAALAWPLLRSAAGRRPSRPVS